MFDEDKIARWYFGITITVLAVLIIGLLYIGGSIIFTLVSGSV